jgi:hypothetical protein
VWWTQRSAEVPLPPPATHLATPPPTTEPPPTTTLDVPPPTTTLEVSPPPTTTLDVPPTTTAPHLRPRTTTVSPPPTTTLPTADARTDGQRAFDEGRRLFLANDVPGAISHFEDAARLMPNNADVQKQLGRAYMRAGDVTSSVAAYRRYLVLSPDASDRAIIEGIIAQH